MRCNGFVRSGVFAAVVALGWLPYCLLLNPIVGAWNARALFMTGATALYIAAISPAGAGLVGRRGAVALVAALAAVGAGLVAGTAAELALALAAILALARSGFLYRAGGSRAVAVEVILGVGALSFARFLGGSFLPSTALALWGFFLVQSLFFLVHGVQAHTSRLPHADPFEEAYRRAAALLE